MSSSSSSSSSSSQSSPNTSEIVKQDHLFDPRLAPNQYSLRGLLMIPYLFFTIFLFHVTHVYIIRAQAAQAGWSDPNIYSALSLMWPFVAAGLIILVLAWFLRLREQATVWLLRGFILVSALLVFIPANIWKYFSPYTASIIGNVILLGVTWTGLVMLGRWLPRAARFFAAIIVLLADYIHPIQSYLYLNHQLIAYPKHFIGFMMIASLLVMVLGLLLLRGGSVYPPPPPPRYNKRPWQLFQQKIFYVLLAVAVCGWLLSMAIGLYLSHQQALLDKSIRSVSNIITYPLFSVTAGALFLSIFAAAGACWRRVAQIAVFGGAVTALSYLFTDNLSLIESGKIIGSIAFLASGAAFFSPFLAESYRSDLNWLWAVVVVLICWMNAGLYKVFIYAVSSGTEIFSGKAALVTAIVILSLLIITLYEYYQRLATRPDSCPADEDAISSLSFMPLTLSYILGRQALKRCFWLMGFWMIILGFVASHLVSWLLPADPVAASKKLQTMAEMFKSFTHPQLLQFLWLSIIYFACSFLWFIGVWLSSRNKSTYVSGVARGLPFLITLFLAVRLFYVMHYMLVK